MRRDEGQLERPDLVGGPAHLHAPLRRRAVVDADPVEDLLDLVDEGGRAAVPPQVRLPRAERARRRSSTSRAGSGRRSRAARSRRSQSPSSARSPGSGRGTRAGARSSGGDAVRGPGRCGRGSIVVLEAAPCSRAGSSTQLFLRLTVPSTTFMALLRFVRGMAIDAGSYAARHGRAMRLLRHHRRRIPASIVYEDDDHVAFLDARPLFEGHTLLVPRAHVVTLDRPHAGARRPVLHRRRSGSASRDPAGHGRQGHLRRHEQHRQPVRPAPALPRRPAQPQGRPARVLLAAHEVRRRRGA